MRRDARQRRVRTDRPETGQAGVATTNPVRTSPAPTASTPAPARAGAADAMARLAALSGPSPDARTAEPSPSQIPQALAARPDRAGGAGAVRVPPTPTPPPPSAVSRRWRRAEAPAVQIGSIEVIVARPAPPPTPAPPRPASVPPDRTRGAANATSAGRLSRPAPLYGLAQG
jgi:hypothetical protein